MLAIVLCACFAACDETSSETERTGGYEFPTVTLDARGRAQASVGRVPGWTPVTLAHGFALRDGDVVVAIAGQEQANVAWRLTEPDGESLEVDLPLGRDGAEVLCHQARHAGTSWLEIRRVDPGGPASVPVEVRVSSRHEDRLCAEAFRAWRAGSEAPVRDQVAGLEQAIKLAELAGRHELATAASLEMARIALENNDLELGSKRLEEAVSRARSGGEILGARVRVRAGTMLVRPLGILPARAWLKTALKTAEQAEDPVSIARAADWLGWIATRRSDLPEANQYLKKALESWSEDYPSGRAWSLIHLAAVRSQESRLGEARRLLDEALSVTPPAAKVIRCEIWLQMGWTHFLSKTPDLAVEAYERGEEACQVHTGTRVGYLDRLGTAERQRGQFGAAERLYFEALELQDLPSSKAHTFYNLGDLYFEMGRLDEARHWLESAIAGFDDNLNGRAHALATLGQVQGYSGNIHGAVDNLEEALEAADSMWLEAYRQGDLVRSTALIQDIDHVFVKWAMALATTTGERSWMEKAFQRSDFARTRNLVAVLGGTGPGRELPTPTDLEDLVSSWPAGVLLLSYVLGDETSHGFVLSDRGLESFPLPAGEILETRANRWLSTLQASPAKPVHRQREALGRSLRQELLEPVESHIARATRWVVVADGALGRIPFGALPDPVGEPSLAGVEVIQAPSVSLLGRLLELRPRIDGRPKIVLFADPVYAPSDPRCDRCTPPGPPQDLDEYSNEETLRRLLGAGKEAAVLAEMVPGSRLLTGLEATRTAVLTEDLSKATLLHFAVHSWIDERNPSRSGIRLSRFDIEGQPVDDLLTLQEIEQLDIRADLVVLSACETAWGERVRGDGLVGFAQAFLLAGASSVIVSLWDVEDHATAELMIELYRQLLDAKNPPARALKEAQEIIRHRPGLESPTYWAGWQVIENWQ